MVDGGRKTATVPAKVGGGLLYRSVERLIAVPRFIVAALILTSIAIHFANVIGRDVFFSPIIWAEEVRVYRRGAGHLGRSASTDGFAGQHDAQPVA